MDSAQAAISRTEARSRELDNRMKATETYFQRRNYNREQRFGTPEEKYEKKRANQERFASYARRANPDTLTDKQLDPLTGEIKWLPALMPPVFEQYRDQLNDLFAQRAIHSGQISDELYQQIKDTTDDLLKATSR